MGFGFTWLAGLNSSQIHVGLILSIFIWKKPQGLGKLEDGSEKLLSVSFKEQKKILSHY